MEALDHLGRRAIPITGEVASDLMLDPLDPETFTRRVEPFEEPVSEQGKCVARGQCQALSRVEARSGPRPRGKPWINCS